MLSVVPGTPGAAIETIFVTTQQTLANAGEVFASDRATASRFGRVDVAVPPDYAPGRPLDNFAITRYQPYELSAYVAALQAAPGDEIAVFVHGYNTTTSEAVFRFAQMGQDFALPDAKVVFSWASAGTPWAYVYDRDSVLYARDDFTQLLSEISRRTDKKIVLIAHSMGAQLVMEGMRQLALTNQTSVLADIDTTVLLSPDIDPDIFRRQVDVIGSRQQPYVVLTSGTDRALRLSSLLIGGRAKVGQLNTPDDVAGLNVVLIDLTSVSNGEHFGHMEAATSPSAIALLRELNDTRSLANSGLLLE